VTVLFGPLLFQSSPLPFQSVRTHYSTGRIAALAASISDSKAPLNVLMESTSALSAAALAACAASNFAAAEARAWSAPAIDCAADSTALIASCRVMFEYSILFSHLL